MSSYDNNLDDWTLSGDYSLKVDRDRQFFAGQFVWSGWDYIGEPTPYSKFPVKASFFGLEDTAGFPKDQYYLFRSEWNRAPMVHIVPMNWTDHQPGEIVPVWAYANEPNVELFLNGASLGTKSFTARRRRRDACTWRGPSAPGTIRASPAGPARVAMRARTGAQASCI